MGEIPRNELVKSRYLWREQNSGKNLLRHADTISNKETFSRSNDLSYIDVWNGVRQAF